MPLSHIEHFLLQTADMAKTREVMASELRP
jgi:hypothetical protein